MENITNNNKEEELFKVKSIDSMKKIFQRIPEPLTYDNLSETDRENLKILLDKVKHGHSIVTELKTKQEFNNPEYLNKAIKTYGIDEVGTNIDSKIYNPYSIATNPYVYYDNIAKEQNQMLINLQQLKK